MPEKLEISKEDAQRMVWGDLEGFQVVKDTIVDTRRWSEDHKVVVRRLSDDKLFIGDYSEGLTENQDESPFDYSEPNFVEAEAYETMVVKYRVRK